MSKDSDLKKLREKLGVSPSKASSTLVGHATPGQPPPKPKAGGTKSGKVAVGASPVPDPTVQLSTADLELFEEDGFSGEIIEADLAEELADEKPAAAPPEPPLWRPSVPPPAPGTRAGDESAVPLSGALTAASQLLSLGESEGEHEVAFEAEPLPPVELESVAEDAGVFYRREAAALASQQPERASVMWIEAARVMQRQGEDAESVVPHLRAALDLAARSPTVVPLVRRIMLELARYEDAQQLAKEQQSLGGDLNARVGALLEAAAVSRYQRGDALQALERLQLALELQPGHCAVLAALVARHLELGQDAAAAEALHLLAEALSVAEERSSCFFMAGTLEEMRLDCLERAEQDYLRAVECDAEHLPALVALCDLYQRQGKWRELCRSLERLAGLQGEAAAKARLLLRAGSLYLDRTGDLEAAARAFAGAAAAAPEDAAPLMRLAYVYEETGRYEELVQTFARLLPLTLDTLGRSALLCRIGWLYHYRLGRVDDAVAAYRQALETQPSYLPALLALGTLYRQRGEFDSLVAMLMPEAEGPDSAERRGAWCVEIGDLLAERLQQPAEALRFYYRALELQPGFPLAFWRLHKHLLQQQRYDQLAELMAQQVRTTTDAKTRSYLLLQLAWLYAGPLHALDQAIEALQQARAVGECRTAAIELIALYERGGQYPELVELLLAEAADLQDPAQAAGRRLQAALVLEDNLGEHDRALEVYRDVLRELPRQVLAIRAMGKIYHRMGRWKELIDLYRQELRADPGATEAAELLFRIGRLYEEQLGQPNEAIAAYKEALGHEGSSPIVLEALARLVRSERKFDELVHVLQQYAAARTEPFAAADALCRAAEVADGHLAQPGLAANLYLAALQRSPGFALALAGLADVQLRQQRYTEAVQTLERLVEVCAGPHERSCLLLRIARLREYRLGERPDPELYDAVAAGAPWGSQLRAEQLRVRRLSGSVELTAVLRESASKTLDPALTAALMLECASLHELAADQAGHLSAAEEAFRQTAEQPAVLWSLGRALRRAEDWTRLGELLEYESEGTTDTVLRLHLLLDAGEANLMAGRLHQAEALAHRCLAMDRRHLPSLSLLARLAGREQAWEALANWQEQLAAACESRENRLSMALGAADLWAERMGDRTRALICLQLALADDPGQPHAFVRAVRLLHSSGDFAQLSKLYSRRIGACEDVELKVRLMRQHAWLLQRKLDDSAGAIAELGRLLALRPDDAEALSSRADLLCSQCRWSDAAQALGLLIERSADGEQRQRARLLLAQVWLQQLQDAKRAREVLEQAQREQPTHIGVKQGLVQVAMAEGQWEEAQQLLQEIADDEQPHMKVWAWLRLAEISRVGLRSEESRVQYEYEALRLAGSHPALLEEVVEAYRSRGEQRRVAEMVRALLSEGLPSEVVRPLRLTLARLLLHDLRQPQEAAEYLHETLRHDPADQQALLLQAQTMEQQGEMERAAACYRQVLERDAQCAEAYRGLHRLMDLLGNPAASEAAAAVLDFLRVATPSEAERVAALDGDAGPEGKLELATLPTEPVLYPLRQLFGQVVVHLGAVYPTELRHPLRASHPVVGAAMRVAGALGLEGLLVSIEGDEPAVAGIGDPVPLMISSRVASQPRSGIFRFWVGRALAGAVTGGALVERLSDRELGELLEALFVARPIDHVVLQLRKQVQRALPRKARKTLEQLEAPRVDAALWARFRQFACRCADGVGMLVCGSPRVSLAEIAALGQAEERLSYLMQFAASEEYAYLRRELWSRKRDG